MPEIKFKRGAEASIPTLDVAEPGFTTDTGKFFIGSANGNVPIANQSYVDASITNSIYTIAQVNANAELVDARGTYSVLGDHIRNIDSQLALKAKQSDLISTNTNVTTNTNAIAVKADKTYVDTQLQAVASGSPKGTYATLAALQTAFPTGNTSIYLVTADGNWYYWNGSAWTAGGVYQSSTWAEGVSARTSTVKNKTFSDLKSRFEDIETNTYKPIQNLLLNGNFETGLTSWINNGTGTATVETSIIKNGLQSMRHTPSTGTMEYLQKITASVGHIIYVSSFAYIVSYTSGSPKMWVTDWAGSTNPVNAFLDTTKIGSWQQLSISRAIIDTGERIYFDTPTGADVVYDSVVAIDLTAVFGAGNEPTSQQMDKKLAKYFNSYFDGTVNLFNSSMPSDVLNSVSQTEKGVANGVALLDSNAKLATTNIPTDVNDTVNAVFTKSKNMFDPSKATANMSVSGGVLASNTGYYASDYIAVVPNTKYVASGSQSKTFSWFDTNKVYISGGTDLTTLTAPSNAYYIRITVGSADYSTYQFEQGNTSTKYMAYGTKVSNISNPITRFIGKKANFLGDSITWGYSPIDGSQMANPYPKLVGNSLGLSVVRNYGISGSTLADEGDGLRNPMVSRYSTMDSDADLIFILGGTNDWALNIPIGAITDNTIYTYYGALNTLITGLLNQYPTQTIVLATPLHRQGDTGGTAPLSAYRDAVVNIGQKYGIIVLDLYGTSGFFPDNTTNYNAIAPDGRHPNDAGHVKLANRVSGFLTTV